MTYLQLVNNVLKRLRERTVSTVGETSYSTLISMLINDAKQEVEQAWDWSALRTTLSATTTSGIFNYELNGFKNNGKMLDVVNDTSNFFMQYETATKFNNYFLNNTPTTGEPRYYSFNGVSDDGDTLLMYILSLTVCMRCVLMPLFAKQTYPQTQMKSFVLLNLLSYSPMPRLLKSVVKMVVQHQCLHTTQLIVH
jgi:hypothetical protein